MEEWEAAAFPECVSPALLTHTVAALSDALPLPPPLPPARIRLVSAQATMWDPVATSDEVTFK